MRDKISDSWNRRTILKTAAVGGGMTLAGCLGDDDDDDVDDTDDDDDVVDDTDDTDDDDDVVDDTDDDDDDEVERELWDTIGLGQTSPVYPANNFPYYPLAQEIMEDEWGVEIEALSFDGSTGMVGGILNEEIALGYLSPTGLTQTINEGMPLVGLLSHTHQFYHAVVARPGIDDWEDLRGGEIAVHAPLTAAEVLPRAMVVEELGEADAVEWNNILGTTSRMAMLEEGEVDAIAAFISGAIQTEHEGYGHIIGLPWDYDVLEQMPANIWAAPAPIIEDNEDVYRTTMEVLTQAFDEIYDVDPEEFTPQALATDIPYPDFPEEVWVEAFEIMQNNHMWEPDYDTNISLDLIDTALDFSVDIGMLGEDERRPAEDLVDQRFVGEIN